MPSIHFRCEVCDHTLEIVDAYALLEIGTPYCSVCDEEGRSDNEEMVPAPELDHTDDAEEPPHVVLQARGGDRAANLHGIASALMSIAAATDRTTPEDVFEENMRRLAGMAQQLLIIEQELRNGLIGPGQPRTRMPRERRPIDASLDDNVSDAMGGSQ